MVTLQMPYRIESNQQGFAFLANVFQQVEKCKFETILLDFQSNKWFDANMLAMLGAIMESAWTNDFKIVNLGPDQEKIFKKTRYSYFGGEYLPDSYQTTIEYRKTKVSEIGSFEKYLEKKLLSHPDMPGMSALLKKKIKESILEIFNNVKLHGDCDFVYTCGQFYPHKGRLDFTIVDIGNTILENVRDYLGRSISSRKAIEWAVRENTTTRRGNIPGGLGFTVIRDFLRNNKGKIQISSAKGYWYEVNNINNSEELSSFFGGTLVNLEFNMDDNCSYCLTSEIEDMTIPF